MHRLARLFQIILKIGVTRIPAIHWAGQIDAIGIPIEQVERIVTLTFEIIVHNVRPDQVICPQRAEGKSEFPAGQNTAAANQSFARGDIVLVDQEPDVARVDEIEHRRQKCEAGDPLVAVCGENGGGAAQHRPADAEAERMHFRLSGDLRDDLDSAEDSLGQILVPGEMRGFLVGTAPRDQENALTLRHGIFHEGVTRL